MTRTVPPPRRPTAQSRRDRPPERPADVISAFVRTLERLGAPARARNVRGEGRR